jgi:hypothetical protein
MTVASIAPTAPRAQSLSPVWFRRLVWVAPLTVVAALAVNFAIRFVVQSVSPGLSRMPQLGSPMITLTVIGSVAAIVAFILVGVLTRRPFFWYPILAVVALLFSWLPDIALAMGGQWAGLAMRFVGPVATLFSPAPGGPPPGAAPGGGGPPPGGGGGGFSAPIEQVLVLMLLHTATAVVCVTLLTRLTRARAPVVDTVR